MHVNLPEEALRSYEEAGNILKDIKRKLYGQIKDGVKLLDIAELVEGEIRACGGTPAFPCNISINEIASHYTPSNSDKWKFSRGDIVKIDIGAYVDGYIADSAFTMEVETDENSDFIRVVEKTLDEALKSIKPGVYTCDIGRIIHDTAASEGYNVLKELFGHNLTRYALHGGVTIPNYDDNKKGKVREGDVLAIEPFITAGTGKIVRKAGGNIYQMIRENPIYPATEEERELLKEISKKFGSLPFAERWLSNVSGLEGLVRSASVRSYPVLISSDRKIVAQSEHTVIVESEGCRVIT
ncbi:type II methionyl aminopeptidase [Methanocella sp. CWC-04]|uniref:Methionine aminopeptidase n=1 Tax=Methanooceanicella nereidis TaxID=2052831 RepID=A0AAP2R9W7_9EURY|nr:type II methionyl aminopeptidase [Methanocella sp. CWC-04]MCD1293596.1 type II methionyl aminopeptidase [Methanocella sp. CWC-04]